MHALTFPPLKPLLLYSNSHCHLSEGTSRLKDKSGFFVMCMLTASTCHFFFLNQFYSIETIFWIFLWMTSEKARFLLKMITVWCCIKARKWDEGRYKDVKPANAVMCIRMFIVVVLEPYHATLLNNSWFLNIYTQVDGAFLNSTLGYYAKVVVLEGHHSKYCYDAEIAYQLFMAIQRLCENATCCL